MAGTAVAALQTGVGTVTDLGTVKLVVGTTPTVLDDVVVDLFTDTRDGGERLDILPRR